MTLLAQKILLVLADAAAHAGADRPASFDAVAAAGCSGFLRVSGAIPALEIEIFAGFGD